MSVPSAKDSYFQGLLSQRLGPERLIDEELVLVIIEDQEFQKLCEIYSSPAVDANGVARRVEEKARRLSLPRDLVPPHNWAIWSAMLEDPRFDLIWKGALDQLREPLPVLRNSLLARLLAFLAKFKKAAETASLIPLLLSAFAATSAIWVLPELWKFIKPVNTPPPVPVALTETNHQLQKINANLDKLTKEIVGCSRCKESSQRSETPQTELSLFVSAVNKHESWEDARSKLMNEAWKENIKAIDGLRASTDEILAALKAGIKVETTVNVSPLDQKLGNIERYTESSASALSGSKTEHFPNIDKNIKNAAADSSEKLAKLQEDNFNRRDLQRTLETPIFTVDSLRKGAPFILQYQPPRVLGSLVEPLVCFAFQVLQSNQNAIILRYRQLQNCTPNTSAVGAIPADDHHSIRLDKTPRLISNISGIGAKGLYMALEQFRGTSLYPPSTRRSFVGIYSRSEWTIHQEPIR